MDTRVRFGASLQGSTNEALRTRVMSLWPAAESALVVDSVLAMENELARGARLHDDADDYLIFDIDHVFVYRRAPGTSSPSLESLIRYVVDDYPRQPHHVLRNHSRDNPFCFLYPLSSLDVLSSLWERRRPNEVIDLNLTTSEIRSILLQPHPEDVQVGRACSFPVEHERVSDADSVVDGGWRKRPPVLFGESFCGPAGMIRERRTGWSSLSLPSASTAVAWNNGRHRETCFGRALRGNEAEAVASLEALERLHVGVRSFANQVICASYNELTDGAVNPRKLFYDTRTAPHADLTPYDDDVAMHWTEATHPFRRSTVLVPAQEVWFRTDRLPGEHRFVEATTNACAVGNTTAEAALFALCEAIERDAYLTMWYLRRPCQQIDPDALTDEPSQMLYERWRLCVPSYDLRLLDITTDTAVPTVAAIAVRKEGARGPRTIHAAATRVSASSAIFSALNELSLLVPADLDRWDAEEARPYLADPKRVDGPRHHFLLYSLDETFDRLKFLRLDETPRLVPQDVDRRSLFAGATCDDPAVILEAITRHLEALNVEVYLKDLTFPWLSDLSCVKAVTPGLYPMWFGYGAQRFAITDRLKKLAGQYLGRALWRASDFNLEFHPFP